MIPFVRTAYHFQMLQVRVAIVGVADETQSVDLEVGQCVDDKFAVAIVGILPIIEDGIDPEAECRAVRNPVVA